MSLISDMLLLAAALIATFYCFMLNARLGAAKKHSEELAAQLKKFEESVTTARIAIAEARAVSDKERETLKSLQASAASTRDEIRHARSALLAAMRAEPPQQPDPTPPSPEKPTRPPKPQTAIEKIAQRRREKRAS